MSTPCPSCRAPVDPEALDCAACGADLVEARRALPPADEPPRSPGAPLVDLFRPRIPDTRPPPAPPTTTRRPPRVLDAADPPAGPTPAARLAAGVLSGRVVGLRDDARVAVVWNPARIGATILFGLAVFPLAALGFGCLMATMLFTRVGSSPIQLLAIIVRGRPGEERRGATFDVVASPEFRRTVRSLDVIRGPLSEGDDVTVQVRNAGGERLLVRGVNHTQGDAPFRAPHDPWPAVLAFMGAWLLLCGLAAFLGSRS